MLEYKSSDLQSRNLENKSHGELTITSPPGHLLLLWSLRIDGWMMDLNGGFLM